MITLEFDERGYVKGKAPIEIDLETFEQYFVFDEHRKILFENYLSYIEILKKCTLELPFYQWLDGSYLNTKRKPKDIDIVTFVAPEVYESCISQDNTLKSPYTEKEFQLDCYFVKYYTKEHERYFEFQADSAYWLHLFSQSNPKHNRNRKKFPKSFVQINHN